MNDSTVGGIPTWWLVSTGVAAIILAIFFVVMCFMVVTLIRLVKELQKPIEGLVRKVEDLVPEVKSLVQKVETLTEKVEGIAESTKGTVDSVGAKAKGIAGAAESVASIAAARFQQLAPILGAAMAGMRLYGMFQESRAKRHGKVDVVLENGEKHDHDGKGGSRGKIKPRRGVEQSGSSSGS